MENLGFIIPTAEFDEFCTCSKEVLTLRNPFISDSFEFRVNSSFDERERERERMKQINKDHFKYCNANKTMSDSRGLLIHQQEIQLKK